MEAPTFAQLILDAYLHLEDAEDALTARARAPLTEAELTLFEEARHRVAAAKRALSTMRSMSAQKKEEVPPSKPAIACARCALHEARAGSPARASLCSAKIG